MPPRRPLVLAAAMMAIFMAAVESTIVATAMPTIVADLGGFHLFSWVFAAYLLKQFRDQFVAPVRGRGARAYYSPSPPLAGGEGQERAGKLTKKSL